MEGKHRKNTLRVGSWHRVALIFFPKKNENWFLKNNYSPHFFRHFALLTMDQASQLREFAHSLNASSSDDNLLNGVSIAQCLSHLSISPSLPNTLEHDGNRATLNNWIRIARDLKSELNIELSMESIALILAGDVTEVFNKVLIPLHQYVNIGDSSNGPSSLSSPLHSAHGSTTSSSLATTTKTTTINPVQMQTLIEDDESETILQQVQQMLNNNAKFKQQRSSLAKFLAVLIRRGPVIRDLLTKQSQPKTRALKLMLKFVSRCLSDGLEPVARGGADLLKELLPMMSSLGGNANTSTNTKIIQNIFEDFLVNMGGLTSTLVCCKTHPSLTSKCIQSMWRCVPQTVEGNRLLFQSVQKQYSEVGDFLHTFSLFVEYLPQDLLRSTFIPPSLLQITLDLCSSTPNLDHAIQNHNFIDDEQFKAAIEVKCFCLTFLSRLVEIFPTQFDSAGDALMGPLVASLLKSTSSICLQPQITSISSLFKIVETLLKTKEKNEFVKICLQSLVYVLIEQESSMVVRDHVLYNLIDLFENPELNEKLPMHEILPSLLRHFKVGNIKLADINLILSICKVPRLEPSQIQQLCGFVSQISLKNAVFSRSASIPLLSLLSDYYKVRQVHVFMAKFARDIVGVIVNKGASNKIRGDEDVAEREVLRMLSIELCAKVLSLGKPQINSVLLGFLEAQVDAEERDLKREEESGNSNSNSNSRELLLNLIEIGKPFIETAKAITSGEKASKERDEWLEERKRIINSPQSSWRSPRGSRTNLTTNVSASPGVVSVRKLKHDTVEAAELKKDLNRFHEQRRSPPPDPVSVRSSPPPASNREELEQLEDEYEENSPRAQRRALMLQQQQQQERGRKLEDRREKNEQHMGGEEDGKGNRAEVRDSRPNARVLFSEGEEAKGTPKKKFRKTGAFQSGAMLGGRGVGDYLDDEVDASEEEKKEEERLFNEEREREEKLEAKRRQREEQRLAELKGEEERLANEQRERQKELEAKRQQREEQRLAELKAEEEEEMRFQLELEAKREERLRRKKELIKEEQLKQQQEDDEIEQELFAKRKAKQEERQLAIEKQQEADRLEEEELAKLKKEIENKRILELQHAEEEQALLMKQMEELALLKQEKLRQKQQEMEEEEEEIWERKRQMMVDAQQSDLLKERMRKINADISGNGDSGDDEGASPSSSPRLDRGHQISTDDGDISVVESGGDGGGEGSGGIDNDGDVNYGQLSGSDPDYQSVDNHDDNNNDDDDDDDHSDNDTNFEPHSAVKVRKMRLNTVENAEMKNGVAKFAGARETSPSVVSVRKMRLDTVENAEMKKSISKFHEQKSTIPANPITPEVPKLDLQHMNQRMWLKVTDKKGRDYWYHKDTKETTWTDPATMKNVEIEKYTQMNTDEVASESEIDETARTETQRRRERVKKHAHDKAVEDEKLREAVVGDKKVDLSNTTARKEREAAVALEKAQRDEEARIKILPEKGGKGVEKKTSPLRRLREEREKARKEEEELRQAKEAENAYDSPKNVQRREKKRKQLLMNKAKREKEEAEKREKDEADEAAAAAEEKKLKEAKTKNTPKKSKSRSPTRDPTLSARKLKEKELLKQKVEEEQRLRRKVVGNKISSDVSPQKRRELEQEKLKLKVQEEEKLRNKQVPKKRDDVTGTARKRLEAEAHSQKISEEERLRKQQMVRRRDDITASARKRKEAEAHKKKVSDEERMRGRQSKGTRSEITDSARKRRDEKSLKERVERDELARNFDNKKFKRVIEGGGEITNTARKRRDKEVLNKQVEADAKHRERLLPKRKLFGGKEDGDDATKRRERDASAERRRRERDEEARNRLVGGKKHKDISDWERRELEKAEYRNKLVEDELARKNIGADRRSVKDVSPRSRKEREAAAIKKRAKEDEIARKKLGADERLPKKAADGGVDSARKRRVRESAAVKQRAMEDEVVRRNLGVEERHPAKAGDGQDSARKRDEQLRRKNRENLKDDERKRLEDLNNWDTHNPNNNRRGSKDQKEAIIHQEIRKIEVNERLRLDDLGGEDPHMTIMRANSGRQKEDMKRYARRKKFEDEEARKRDLAEVDFDEEIMQINTAREREQADRRRRREQRKVMQDEEARKLDLKAIKFDDKVMKINSARQRELILESEKNKVENENRLRKLDLDRVHHDDNKMKMNSARQKEKVAESGKDKVEREKRLRDKDLASVDNRKQRRRGRRVNSVLLDGGEGEIQSGDDEDKGKEIFKPLSSARQKKAIREFNKKRGEEDEQIRQELLKQQQRKIRSNDRSKSEDQDGQVFKPLSSARQKKAIREFNKKRGEEDERIRNELLEENSRKKRRPTGKTSPRIQSPHNSAFDQERTHRHKKMAEVTSRERAESEEAAQQNTIAGFVAIGGGIEPEHQESPSARQKRKALEAVQRRREEDEFERQRELKILKMNQ